MFMFLYNFAWTVIIIFCIPPATFIRKGRFAERLGLNIPATSLGEGNIWVHALSVGEVISAVPLIRSLRLEFPHQDIIFTVTTSRGMEIARKELKDEVRILLTMPVDFWWCVRRIVNYIRPSLFILIETDVWPGLIYHLKRRGIKSILVNGRVSPRTFKSYRRFSIIVRKIFEPLELFLMQSDLDKERLLRVGIDSKKLRTAGNIKFDRDWRPMYQKEHDEWLDLLGIDPETLIWVAGSTHQGEEEIVLEVYKKLRSFFPTLFLILAPRKIEQADQILMRAKSMGFRGVLRTELLNTRGPYDVLILNTFGELGRIYGLGKVSFVGGSLVPMGGHNLLEPASFGCPVLFGPCVHNFVLMSKSLEGAGAGWRVRDSEDLFRAVKTLLENNETRSRMGRLAKEFVETNRGTLERVVSQIGIYIDEIGGHK